MKKFVAIYMAPAEEMQKMMKDATPEQQKHGMDDWYAWMEKHKADIVDIGAPLGQNKRVTKDSISDVHNDVAGFSIIQAESHEEAAKLMQDSPNFAIPGSYIEVLSWVDVPKK